MEAREVGHDVAEVGDASKALQRLGQSAMMLQRMLEEDLKVLQSLWKSAMMLQRLGKMPKVLQRMLGEDFKALQSLWKSAMTLQRLGKTLKVLEMLGKVVLKLLERRDDAYQVL